MLTKWDELGIDKSGLQRLVEQALAEDRAREDATTAIFIPPAQRGRGIFVSKARGVVCGLPVAAVVFAALDLSLAWRSLVHDGASIQPGDKLAEVEGALAPILSAERVALNFLQHLSGIATLTRRFLEQLSGTSARLRDTRKTVPGLRDLQKYAVRIGGGSNHRLHLADGVLLKDNHLSALRARGLTLADAVRLARDSAGDLPVEIEVTTVAEAAEALDAGAAELLLDNMPPAQMREVVALADGRAVLEASGGITLETAREVAQTGVDFLAVGALTHSARALDISLDVEIAHGEPVEP
ncbi:MAG TPA: carboxylating nicotinate-nucleotide diphosphorylase [Dehalococcoidia bacterium]|nr:carboxylating nicotinate-nucleotide diphosphorylase [Dehalococcoidia bacterium]